MKGKFSLTAVVAVVALAVSAPAALGEPGPSRDWFERAADAAIRDTGATPYADAFERPDTANRAIEATPDWFERAAAAAVRDAGATPYADAFERPEVTSVPSTTPTVVDSDSGRAWLELGIAFAIGLTLALGLAARIGLRPNRPLAQ
jgi:hypothetical protein